MRASSIPILLLLSALATPTRAGAQTKTPAAAEDERQGDALARDLELRWGRTREVQVVVNRLYPKDLRFELNVFAAVLPNDPFLVYLNPGLRMAFHASEQWAIEIGGSYALGLDTGLRRELTEADALVQARLRDKVLGRFSLAVLWSPIYGKLAWTNTKVGHFDLYFLAEASGLFADAVPDMDLKGGVWGGIGLGLGFRFFVTRLLSLRVEFRQRVEIREGLGQDAIRLSWPSEISLGLSFLMGRGRRRAE
ncbi:MAG: outer membrane beta-barrel domain-containing protein [Polyangia bacterium]|jgi:outer membrane beta-barrel protein|nr:outer membrane beta-barrel domain-containing protein [Polyangia bacterium]